MLPRNKNKSPIERTDHQKTRDTKPGITPEDVTAAHEQAEEDIRQDPDLSIHSPNDDLDESETARLGGDKNDLA